MSLDRLSILVLISFVCFFFFFVSCFFPSSLLVLFLRYFAIIFSAVFSVLFLMLRGLFIVSPTLWCLFIGCFSHTLSYQFALVCSSVIYHLSLFRSSLVLDFVGEHNFYVVYFAITPLPHPPVPMGLLVSVIYLSPIIILTTVLLSQNS